MTCKSKLIVPFSAGLCYTLFMFQDKIAGTKEYWEGYQA